MIICVHIFLIFFVGRINRAGGHDQVCILIAKEMLMREKCDFEHVTLCKYMRFWLFFWQE